LSFCSSFTCLLSVYLSPLFVHFTCLFACLLARSFSAINSAQIKSPALGSVLLFWVVRFKSVFLPFNAQKFIFCLRVLECACKFFHAQDIMARKAEQKQEKEDAKMEAARVADAKIADEKAESEAVKALTEEASAQTKPITEAKEEDHPAKG
jgi:hypothetical protein